MNKAPLVVLVAALCGAGGLLNPVDVIARGKFVRNYQTLKGEVAGTVCLPAATEADRATQLAALPTLMADLERAGARAVALDVDAAAIPPATFTASALPIAVIGGTTASAAGAPAAGHRDFVTAGPADVVMSAPASAGGVPPLGAVALGLHRAATVRAGGAQLDIGDQGWAAHGGVHPFMPYEIPFFDWDDRSDWSGVAGRTIFVGACRLDRHLTRFGRQPAVVAHGELLETLRDGVVPREGSRAGDAVLGALSALAALAAARTSPRVGPLLVAVVGVGLVGAAQLSGLWIGLTGVLVGALLPLFLGKRAR